MQFNYKPNHSEVCKGLHEQLDDEIITRYGIIKEESKRQEIPFLTVIWS
ncbi:hypothetical protein [Bacillus sp. UNC438CL73TsuS30]